MATGTLILMRHGESVWNESNQFTGWVDVALTDKGRAEAKRAVAEATASLEASTRDRAAVAASVPADLLALYDKLATRGAGAAVLRARTCEWCHMVLSGTDLNTLRRAPEDEVVTCPECGSILVRTGESGL